MTTTAPRTSAPSASTTTTTTSTTPSRTPTSAKASSTSSLYALTIEAQDVDGQLAVAFEMAASDDPEQQEQAEALIASLLQASHHNQALLLQRANAICSVHEALLGKARFLRQSAAERIARAEQEERGAERLLDYLSRCLSALHPGQRSFSLPEFTLRSRTSSAVAIEDEQAIPPSLRRHEIRIRLAPEAHAALPPLLDLITQATASTTASSCEVLASSSPDKASIREACSGGQSVSGARLESRTHWSIQ